jgi:hypothetical protein
VTSAIAAVLAHQGGWDEMLMVAGPILVFWLILRLARRRAERMTAPGDPGTPEGPEGPTSTDPTDPAGVSRNG